MLRKMMLTTVVLATVVFPTVSYSGGTSIPQRAVGTVCWPLHFAGITLGITNDSQVRRLLGRGIFRRDEGDVGGRYFIDKKRRTTLHVVMYTDSVVGELTIQEGLDISLQQEEQEKAISQFFNPEDGFGNWHALRLGASKADVVQNLGDPAHRNNDDNIWEYTTSCACEIPQFFTLHFRDGHLFKVVFSAPAG